MYYRVGGKPYFALAFRNDSGGYELRNPRFKGSTSKDITHIRQQGEPRDTCFVFEGFLDFLSFLTIRQQKSPDMPCTDWQDYVILNSTANTDKALYPLADYGHIHCMLDNDEAGRKAVEAIRQEYKWRVRDASHLYSGHNDLNDYLRSLKVKQSQDLTVTDKPQPEQDNRQNPGEKRILHPNRTDGENVRLIQAAGEMGEAIAVAKEIGRMVGGVGMLEAQRTSGEKERKVRSFHEIAVLYRTHRQGELLETCLRKEGIPYVVAGRESFLKDEKVRLSAAFFRCLLDSGQTAVREEASPLFSDEQGNPLGELLFMETVRS